MAALPSLSSMTSVCFFKNAMSSPSGLESAHTVDAATAQAQALVDHYAGMTDAKVKPSSWLITDPAMCERVWTIRETGASATALTIHPNAPDPVVGWEDAAVDPLRLGDYLREFQALVDRHGYQTSLYGHFGDGCIHARIPH